MRKFEMHPNKE